MIGSTTDPEGNFKLTKVPVGNHALKISFVGYKEITLSAIILNSGKEIVHGFCVNLNDEKSFAIVDFDRLEISSAFDVTVEQGFA